MSEKYDAVYHQQKRESRNIKLFNWRMRNINSFVWTDDWDSMNDDELKEEYHRIFEGNRISSRQRYAFIEFLRRNNKYGVI